jgi:protocatechuate 3,4-dioxygenase beta subunit
MNLTALLCATLNLAAASEPERIFVEGLVLQSDGRPAAGAEVYLSEAIPLWGHRSQLYARTRCDNDGKYRLPLPSEQDDRYREPRPLTLWTFRKGNGVARKSLPRNWPAHGAPVVINFATVASFEVCVLGPDGQPAPGVRIAPARVCGRILPEALVEAVYARTDSRGTALLAGFAVQDVSLLRLESDRFGTQQLPLLLVGAGRSCSVRLHSAGKVEGRITAPDPAAARGLRVYLSTKADTSDDSMTGGFTEVMTDGEGRFMAPALAEGTLTTKFLPHLDLPFRGTFASYPDVEAGRTTRIEASLKAATQVNGVVREQGTGKPLAGALVQIDWTPGWPRSLTDAEGRYSSWLVGTAVTPHVPAYPRGYFYPKEVLDTVPIPAGARQVTAKPILLERGMTIRGRVIDSTNKPVAGAAVAGWWKLPEGEPDQVATRTDRDGAFALEGLDSRAEIRVTAHDWDAGYAASATIRPGSKSGSEPLTLCVSPEGAVALTGRVLDSGRRPMVGALVRLRSAVRDIRGYRLLEQPVLLGDDEGVRTDAAGRFQTPQRLQPDLEYRAEVETAGNGPCATEWVEPPRGKTATFADVVLLATPRLRTLAGRVVDRQGKPIAGVSVFQSGDGPHRTSASTDSHGQFHLHGVFEGRAFVFIQVQCLPLRGQLVDVTDRPVELVLDKDAPLPGPSGALPQALPRSQERALAWKALKPLVMPLLKMPAWQVLLSGMGNLTYRLVDVGPRVNPSLALEAIERGVLGEYADMVRFATAEGLLDEALDEALAIAETIPDARYRTLLYIIASDRVPSAERARKQALLDTALLYARSDPSEVGKLDGFGMVAMRWLDLGETEKATRIFREGQGHAVKMPAPNENNRRSDGPHARGRFAAKLARIDTKAALELAQGFTDPYHDWYISGVALGLAERDPPEAERVAGMCHYGTSRLPRLCGRMAPYDLSRARKIAEHLEDPHERTDALIAMAQSLVKANPEAAGAVLEEALTALERLHREGRGSVEGYYSPCVNAGSLLPVAEHISADCLRRCFWRALALRPPRPARGHKDGRYESVVAELALLLARYDRTSARTVLEPAIRQLPALFDPRNTHTPNRIFAAAALIDPSWAVGLLDVAPDRAWPGGYQPRAEARVTLADLLARTGDARWKFAFSRYAYIREDSRDDER